MKTFLIPAAIALSFAATLVSAADSLRTDQSFGTPMTLKQAIKELEAGRLNGDMKIIGQVTEVCQAKGCWMILMDGDVYARVTFEDYGFFVPIETSMQRSVIFGSLGEVVLSGAQAGHHAQDAGAQATLQVSEEVREYSIVAKAVLLENRS